MLRRVLFPDAPPAPSGGGGTPPPEGGTSAGEQSLIDNLMADLDSPAPGGEPPAGSPPPEPPKPPEGAKPPPAAKPPEKPAAGKTPPKAPDKAAPKAPPAAPAKPGPAKPPEAPLNWDSAPKQFKAAHEALKTEFTRVQTDLQGKLNTVEGQLREMGQRRFLTPDDEAKYGALEKRQQELEAILYSQDYQQSPEFKEKYEKPAQRIFATVTKELKGMTVKYKDGEEDKTRAATMEDFGRIRALSDNPAAQRRLAKEMFGEDADIIMNHVRKLDDITEQANAEIESKRTGWATEQKKLVEQSQKTFAESRQVYLGTDQALVNKFPHYFAEDPANPEWNNALKEGLAYVDTNSAQFNAKTPAEKAKTSAIIRRWAASWPANQILIKQLKAQLEAKETELAQYRKSDPGSIDDGSNGGTPPADGGPGGSDAMADEIERAAQASRA